MPWHFCCFRQKLFTNLSVLVSHSPLLPPKQARTKSWPTRIKRATKELLNDKKELFDFTSYFYCLIIIASSYIKCFVWEGSQTSSESALDGDKLKRSPEKTEADSFIIYSFNWLASSKEGKEAWWDQLFNYIENYRPQGPQFVFERGKKYIPNFFDDGEETTRYLGTPEYLAAFLEIPLKFLLWVNFSFKFSRVSLAIWHMIAFH